jgi:hypothetical protein
LISPRLDRGDREGDGALINGVLVSLGRYQTSVDHGAVGKGPDVASSRRCGLPMNQQGPWTGQNPPDPGVFGYQVA